MSTQYINENRKAVKSNMELALYYASIGYKVFPLKPRDKTPLTAHGFQDATTYEAQIKAWWGKWPDANIGIRCNGLLVLDVDNGDKGLQSLLSIEALYEKLPATWTVKTGGGTKDKPKERGRQYIFKVLESLNIRPGAGKYGYDYIDARANDSYIVASGSITNYPYETISGTPEEIADAPEWLIEFIQAAQPGKGISRTIEPLKEHSRHDSLISYIGKWRNRGFSEDEILTQALAMNAAADVPLNETEVKNMCRQYEHQNKTNGNGHSEEVPAGPGWVSLADVQTEAVKWLWPPYIPIGKLTLLEGDPGIGKSFVSLAIACAVSLGISLPFQKDMEYCGKVLLASAEDGLGDTIRPRLESMGANLSNIAAIKELMTLDENGFAMLESYISEVLPILLVIDPLVAYFSGDMDINRANAVRWGTSRLAKLAEKWNLAVLAVRHLTKGGSLKPIYRGLGSIDFTASARSVLLVGCDPDNDQVRGVVHIKSNLAKTGEAIGYEMRDDGFYWLEHSELTSERILSGRDENESQLESAKRFLREYLTDKPATWQELMTEAESYGVSEHTLRRARESMKLESTKQGELGKRGGGKWLWMLPGKVN